MPMIATTNRKLSKRTVGEQERIYLVPGQANRRQGAVGYIDAA